MPVPVAASVPVPAVLLFAYHHHQRRRLDLDSGRGLKLDFCLFASIFPPLPLRDGRTEVVRARETGWAQSAVG